MAKREKWETPLEKEEREKKLISFSDRWEEELKESLFNLTDPTTQEVHTVIQEKYEWHHERPDEEWDVPITEEIKYFDPELSYEITGYRPITMEKGLNFEPDLFRERAITYDRTHKYTEFPPGTKPYNDFWNEEFRRCQEGLTIGKYRLTGDHYFFLNYYRMQVINEGSTAGLGRTESFPRFMSKQYEWFHYVEMAEKLHKDVCALKARAVGWSEMTASMAVRPYTTNKGYRTLLTCAAEQKLTPLKNKCWKQLDWLNLNTQGGMRHVRQVVNNNDTKRASIRTVDGVEYGWRSEIDSTVADDPQKVRGDRVDRLVFEEAGSAPRLQESWIQGDALVSIGGEHFGTKIALGCVCAGTKVWDKNGHLINIEDITKDSGIIGFKNGKANIEPITYIQEPAYKECVRITFTDGKYLECSEDHPILFRYQYRPRNKENLNLRNNYYKWNWIQAKDIQKYKGRNIVATFNGLSIFGNSTLFDPYFVGLLIGDGSYGYDKTPRLFNCDDIIWNYVDSKYTTVVEKYYKTKDNKDYYEKRINGIASKLREVGIYGQTKTNKRLPSNYMDLTQTDASELLAGLFDTDGTIAKRDGRIIITQSSYEIQEQIQTLLLKFGIHSTIRKQEPRIMPGRKDKNPWYLLEINDFSGILNFYKYIPIKIQYKIDTLKKAINTRKKSSFYNKHSINIPEGIREIGVKSVEHIGVRRIYNLTANDSHTYIANGVITHNTGGDDMAVTGLSNLFTNPEAYNILPFKNYDTDDGRPELTSFFLPAHKFSLKKAYLDDRGVTNHIEFKKYYQAIRAKLTDKDYLRESSEHCFTPREALSKHADNVFDPIPISERLVQIKVQGNYIKPKRMALFWDPQPGGVKKVRAVEHPDSHLLVVEPPVLDEMGQPFKNLYVAGIDAIDMGKSDSATDYDVSDFCVVVKKRQFGQNEPKYVALYRFRPNNIREAFELTMRLLVWYNCKAILEYTKISIQTYFKEHGMGHLFMPRPKVALQSGVRKPGKQLVGIQGTPSMIQHGLELIQNFLMDYWYTIDFEDILDEMLNYSYENKRKFDIIAAMICCEIGDEDMTGLSPSVVDSIKNQWKDIGYYIDENGYRRRGVIPNDRNWKAH